MENKKKPSVLSFVSSHNSFNEDGVFFTPEMLKWPFYKGDGEKITDKAFTKIHQKAIKALTQMSPFDAKISIFADVDKHQFIFAGRLWGEIYLKGVRIVSFSHHTEKDNVAFRYLDEWVELKGTFEENMKVLFSWTSEDWVDFFRKRILLKAESLNAKAAKKRGDAVSLEKRATELFIALIGEK